MTFTDRTTCERTLPITVKVESIGAMGNLIIRIDGAQRPDDAPIRLYWNGPGSRPRLVFGDQLVVIDDAYPCYSDRDLRRYAMDFATGVARLAMQRPN